MRRRHRAFWDKFVTNIEHETYRNQTKLQQILKQINNDIKETARIQRNTNESKLEWNSDNHVDTLITSAEFK